MSSLAIDLKTPQIIQVVGTNGKGSTSAFLESILVENGLRVGLFTSPHLCSAKERIRLNKQDISDQQFALCAQKVLSVANMQGDPPSFFESILATALLAFQRYEAQIYILEAGLGGRLDATTACHPRIVGVSAIDIDHPRILGDTVEKIAGEKLGGAHENQLIVVGPQSESAKNAVQAFTKAKNLTTKNASSTLLPLGLAGDFQQNNAGLALEISRNLPLKLDEEKIAQGLRKVSWPARFEEINRDKKIIIDSAHNPHAINALIDNLIKKNLHQKPTVLVFGATRGHNTPEKIRLLVEKLNIVFVFVHGAPNKRAEQNNVISKYFLDQRWPTQKILPYKNFDQVKPLNMYRESPATSRITPWRRPVSAATTVTTLSRRKLYRLPVCSRYP